MTIRTGVTAKVSGAGVASLAVPLTGLSPGSNGLLVLVGWNGVGNGVKSVADNMSGTYAEAWFGPGGAGGTSFVDAFVLSPSSVARE